MAGETPTSRRVCDLGRDDSVLPFAVAPLDVRGRVVRLGAELNRIVRQHAYPPEIARAVGEAAALTVLLGSALKTEGRLQLQTRSQGVIGMLVVDFDAPGSLRAYARFDAEALEGARRAHTADPASLLGHGHLALTVDHGPVATRYQGVVALDGRGLETAAHEYFLQSEQIPTLVKLAVGEIVPPGGNEPEWRAGGLIVQFLPDSPERRRAVQHEQGAPPDHPAATPDGDDAWDEATALTASVEAHELLDPLLSSERLLYRLFHERGVTVFDHLPVRHACRCGQARIESLLRQFRSAELRDMIDDAGRISVTCEFCGAVRYFDPADFDVAP